LGPTVSTAPRNRILVWDLPTRLFHWLLATSFFAAYLISESERWRALHAMLGYTAAGLVAFRLLWGVVGTRYARFTGFTWSPRAALSYLRSLGAGSPEHHTGHNPAASWAVLGLLVMVATSALSGWAVLNDVGPAWLEEVHDVIANGTIALVALHVAAVIVSSVLHRENLVRAMVTGTKSAATAAAAGSRRWVAALLAGAVIAFWTGWIPAPGIRREAGLIAMWTQVSASQGRHSQHDDRRKAEDAAAARRR
jgi:cytochrome b